MLAWLPAVVAALSAKSIARGEWDVFSGTSVQHNPQVLYSFELHPSRSNPANLVSTVWLSSGHASDELFKPSGLLAQIDIAFTHDNGGKFTIDGKTRDFAFTDDGYLSASFSINEAILDLKILSDKVIEISYDDQDFVAILQTAVAPSKRALHPRNPASEGSLEVQLMLMWMQLKQTIGIPKEYSALFDAVCGVLLVQIAMFMIWKTLSILCCGQAPAPKPRPKKRKRAEPKPKPKPTEEEEAPEPEQIKEKQD